MRDAAEGDGAFPYLEEAAAAIELHRLLAGVHHQPFHLLVAGKLFEILHHAGAQPLAAKFGSQRHKADLGFIAAHKEATHGDGRSVGESISR